MKEHVCYAADGGGGGGSAFQSLVPDSVRDIPSLIQPETHTGDTDTITPTPLPVQSTDSPPPLGQQVFHYESDAQGHRALVIDGKA